MGSCISKCNVKRTSSFYELRNINDKNNNIINQVQDKLVISSSQIAKPPSNIPILSKSNKISPVLPVSRFNYSFSPTSSFSNATTTTTSITSESSLSSLSSTASSSILSSKDRSFSNEFLWSCLKENPHVIRINSIKEAALSLPNSTPKTDKVTIHPQNSPFHTGAKQPKNNVQQRIISRSTISTTPQKRVRSTSPINAALLATRQKSFRSSSPSDSFSARTALRSPSPSRRFTGGEDRNYSSRGFNNIANKESSLKRVSSGTKKVNLNPVHSAASFPSSSRKDNKIPRPGSPASCNGSMGLRPSLGNRETSTHRIGSKIDEVAVKLAMESHQESDYSVPMEEDINNPHISLDCFIFL